jgi:hypothetical protein
MSARPALRKGVRFHQDNARPHIARVTTDLINKFGWDTVIHPPYSPDVMVVVVVSDRSKG